MPSPHEDTEPSARSAYALSPAAMATASVNPVTCTGNCWWCRRCPTRRSSRACCCGGRGTGINACGGWGIGINPDAGLTCDGPTRAVDEGNGELGVSSCCRCAADDAAVEGEPCWKGAGSDGPSA